MLIANAFKMFKLKQKYDSSYSYQENVQTVRDIIKRDNIAVSWKMSRSLFIWMWDFFSFLYTHVKIPLAPKQVNEFRIVVTLNWKGGIIGARGRYCQYETWVIINK